MMHPAAYLAAVLAAPQDDEPRLRYAAWLDERDDALGEFIRLQCQLERLPLHHPLRLELETRERELEADHGERWLAAVDPQVDWCVFRRGFPEEIAVSAAVFLRQGEAIFARAPIQQVHFHGARDRVGDLAASPLLARVTYLDLSNNHLRDQGVRLLAQSPYLTNVEGLNLSSTAVGDAGLRALAACPSLRNLRELFLCDNRITRSGLRALAGSPLMNRLETLSLRSNACGEVSRDIGRPALALHV